MSKTDWNGTLACAMGAVTLLSYNFLYTTMPTFVKEFGGDQTISDNAFLIHQMVCLAMVILLFFVTEVNTHFVLLTLAGYANLLGTLVIIMSLGILILQTSNAHLFYCGVALYGVGCGLMQTSSFVVAAHRKLASYSLAESLSIGLGVGGLISWLIGLVVSMVCPDRETKGMTLSPAIGLTILSSVCALITVSIFIATYWSKLTEEEAVCQASSLPNSNEPLFNETQGNVRMNSQLPETHWEDKQTSTVVVNKRWTRGICYIYNSFIIFVVSLFCFPAIGPFRWTSRLSPIWFIGGFQIGDTVGRILAPYTCTISLSLFTSICHARLFFCFWVIAAAKHDAVSQGLCITLLAVTSGLLFTVLMRQAPSEVHSSIAGNVASLCILGLLVGITAGLWLSKNLADALIDAYWARDSGWGY